MIKLIFLVGLPGNHFERTKELIEEIPLTRRDVVYLSKLRPRGSIQDVDGETIEEQMEGFRNILHEKRGLRADFGISTYYIDDFFYA